MGDTNEEDQIYEQEINGSICLLFEYINNYEITILDHFGHSIY